MDYCGWHAREAEHAHTRELALLLRVSMLARVRAWQPKSIFLHQSSSSLLFAARNLMGIERKSRSFLDPLALARLARLPLLARRPMQGNVSGRHISPHRGASIEFAQYRKYVPGDDLRRLDWRAFGRTDRHYIKESEADTNLRLCLVVDTSGSMAFGSTGITKFEFAKRIAGALGYLAVQQGDAVGLSCLAEGIVNSLPPRRNP